MSEGKIIIGIAGANGSGKDAVSDYLVKKYKAKKLVFSDLLKEALLVFLGKKKIGRRDFAWLATILRERFGEGILAIGMKKKIEKAKNDLIIISGVRDLGELEMIRSYPLGKLLFVDTNTETRWQRLKKRGLKADDTVSLEEFKKELEKLPSERRIEALKKKADFKVDNNGTFEELEKQLREVMRKVKVA